MIELQKFIVSQLAESGKQVYFEQAPERDPFTNVAPKFPYIVYRFGTSSNDDMYREDIPLIVNVWDNNPDTIPLDLLAESLDKKLKNIRHLDEYQQLTFVKEGRSPLTEPDLTIKGRQLRYTIRRYERVV